MSSITMNATPTPTSPVPLYATYIYRRLHTLEVPLRQNWQTERELYHHLLSSHRARATIYCYVNAIRHFRHVPIIIHHPLLFYPLILRPNTSDRVFIRTLQERRNNCSDSGFLPPWYFPPM